MPRKLPFIQLFPADWIQDTRILSLDARGAWIDLLCAMWIAPERGKLVWKKAQFEQFLGTTHDPEYGAQVFNELQDSGVGVFEYDEATHIVTVMSRRILREEAKRNQTVKRVRRHRNASVTQKKRPILHISDTILHISDKEKNPPTPLPDWLPTVAWFDYLEYRKKKKAPNTERAKQLAIKTLEKLRGEGNDPEAVINQSILGGWTGLFPLRAANGRKPLDTQTSRMPEPTKRPTRDPKEVANARDILARLTAGIDKK